MLQEVSGNRLPLFKFIEIYEKRYHRSVSVSELYRMRDLIEIQEMDGTGRTVVLVNQNKNNRASPASSRGGDDNDVSVNYLPINRLGVCVHACVCVVLVNQNKNNQARTASM